MWPKLIEFLKLGLDFSHTGRDTSCIFVYLSSGLMMLPWFQRPASSNRLCLKTPPSNSAFLQESLAHFFIRNYSVNIRNGSFCRVYCDFENMQIDHLLQTGKYLTQIMILANSPAIKNPIINSGARFGRVVKQE